MQVGIYDKFASGVKLHSFQSEFSITTIFDFFNRIGRERPRESYSRNSTPGYSAPDPKRPFGYVLETDSFQLALSVTKRFDQLSYCVARGVSYQAVARDIVHIPYIAPVPIIHTGLTVVP